jgi:hypothetical protein
MGCGLAGCCEQPHCIYAMLLNHGLRKAGLPRATAQWSLP